MNYEEALKTYKIEEFNSKIKPLITKSSNLDLLWQKIEEEASNCVKFLSKIENKSIFDNTPEEKFKENSLKVKTIRSIIYEYFLEKFYIETRKYKFEQDYISGAKEIASKMKILKENGCQVDVDFIQYKLFITQFGSSVKFSTEIISSPSIIKFIGVDPTKNEQLFNLFAIFRMDDEEVALLRELYAFGKYTKI